jgi:hypothetical protein
MENEMENEVYVLGKLLDSNSLSVARHDAAKVVNFAGRSLVTEERWESLKSN